MREGIKLKVVLLDPGKSIDNLFKKREDKEISPEIEKTLVIAKSLGFFEEKGFEIRFVNYLPPYTGIMIDGDVENTGVRPRDDKGELRVQPGSVYDSQHEGVIIQLYNTKRSPESVFKFFSNDLRKIWRNAKKKHHF